MPPSPTLYLHYRSEKAMTVFRVWLKKYLGHAQLLGNRPTQEKMSPATTECNQALHYIATLLSSKFFDSQIIYTCKFCFRFYSSSASTLIMFRHFLLSRLSVAPRTISLYSFPYFESLKIFKLFLYEVLSSFHKTVCTKNYKKPRKVNFHAENVLSNKEYLQFFIFLGKHVHQNSTRAT